MCFLISCNLVAPRGAAVVDEFMTEDLVQIFFGFCHCFLVALSKLLKCEGGAGPEGAILTYVGHLQLIST